MSPRLLVLGWHNIDPTPAFPAPQGVGRQGFARQLRLLANFATVLPLTEALDRLEAGAPLPPRAVALTFDDGYRDSLELVVPALARHGLPATFFLVPGLLSGQVRAWWEDLAWAFDAASAGELVWQGRRYDLAGAGRGRGVPDQLLASLKRLDHSGRLDAVEELVGRLVPRGPRPEHFLDWDAAHALVAAGHHIGSHSLTHAILAREREETQAVELADSRSRLEAGLGGTVDVFAYPNGTAADYGAVTVRQAREAGYRCAVTTRPGLARSGRSRYELRRYVIDPDTDLRGVARDLWWLARDRIHARRSGQ